MRGRDERGGLIRSGICYPDDICKLLVNYKENKDNNFVIQINFEEDEDLTCFKKFTCRYFRTP